MEYEEKKTSGDTRSLSNVKQAMIQNIFYAQYLPLLWACELSAVRGLCDDHVSCPDCGHCIHCTVPHRCCCGKCGVLCAHDHRSFERVCFQMQELQHPRGTLNAFHE